MPIIESNKIKLTENIHVCFWLVKDLCWMMEYKTLGFLMIIPTIMLAIWIVYKTANNIDLWINLSVLFWIISNAIWMILEFISKEQFKNWISIPFCIGLIFCIIYLYKSKIWIKT